MKQEFLFFKLSEWKCHREPYLVNMETVLFIDYCVQLRISVQVGLTG